MTKKAIITQAELKRFANLATTQGVTIEIERDGTVIRIMPFKETTTGPKAEDSSTLPRGPNALQEWRVMMEKRFGVGSKESARPSKSRRSKKPS